MFPYQIEEYRKRGVCMFGVTHMDILVETDTASETVGFWIGDCNEMVFCEWDGDPTDARAKYCWCLGKNFGPILKDACNTNIGACK